MIVRSRNLVLFTVSIIVLTSIVIYSADAAGIPKKAISTVSKFLESDLPTTTLFTDVANTISANHQFGSNNLLVENPAKTNAYTITGAAIAANRTLNLPVTTGTDTLVTLGLTQTFTGNPLTINNLALGGQMDLAGNTLQSSGHVYTFPSNTGTVLMTNGSGSSLSGVVTSITGTANNVTTSGAGAVTLNLGSNVVTTGGSAQTISKLISFTNGANINGLGIKYVSKTTAYTATATDDVIAADTSTSGFAVTLPSAATVGSGKAFVIENTGQSAANVLQIKTTGGQTVGGASNINMTYGGQALGVYSDGSNWQIFKNLDTSYDGFYIKGSTTRWYGNAMNQGASGTITWTGATLRAFPWIVSHTITIDKIQTEVSTAANPTTTVCRMGIYRDNGNAYPQALVSGSDTGTFTTTAAVKTGTFGSPITLQEGLYWLTVGCDTAGTTQPTFRGVPVASVAPVLGYVSTMGANGAGTGYTSSGGTPGTTALPIQYPAGATVLANTINPMVLVEIQKG